MTTVSVDVDVDLCDFDTQDLIEELELRGREYVEYSIEGDLIHKIFHLRRQGRDYEEELDRLLYIKTGRAI